MDKIRDYIEMGVEKFKSFPLPLQIVIGFMAVAVLVGSVRGCVGG